MQLQTVGKPKIKPNTSYTTDSYGAGIYVHEVDSTSVSLSIGHDKPCIQSFSKQDLKEFAALLLDMAELLKGDDE